MKKSKKYEVIGFSIYQNTYLVDAEDEMDAVEKAMELTNPTESDLCEETFELVKEIGYAH
jgi:hypothetical protein